MKKKLFKILLIIFVISGFYAFFIEPNFLIVKHYKLQDESLKGLKIVFASDFHIRPNQEKRLKKVVKMINEQNPDVVLSVGDFVNGHKEKSTMPIEKITNELKNVRSKYGFYTVLGNHDWYIYGERVTKSLEDNGIKVLANNNTYFEWNNKKVYIAGVEDFNTRHALVWKALDGVENPTILLSHSPDIFPRVKENVNLTLSGHLHGGQIRIPLFGAIMAPSGYGDSYSKGKVIVENGKKMIVTRGIGNSILNIRFCCLPEIVVIEFE